MTETQLVRLAAVGSIPPKDVAHWRAPPLGEVSPHPRSDEVVTFRIFYARGLGHPAYPFLLGLPEGWKIGLHHLNPTRMLHIAGFVTVCEAFFGIDPHMDLFREMFVGCPVRPGRRVRRRPSRLWAASACSGGPGRPHIPGMLLWTTTGGGTMSGSTSGIPPGGRRRPRRSPGVPRRSRTVGFGGLPGARRTMWE